MVTIIKTDDTAGYGVCERNVFEVRCLHTDSKPTEDIPVNTLCLEVDTLDIYYFDGSSWSKSGS